MEQVKLLSMTVMLTVLIWASADSLVNEAVSISVVFEPVPASGSNLLVTTPPSSEVYDLQISGPRKIVEDVQAQAPLPVRLKVADRPTGPTFISLDKAMIKQEMAEQRPEFQKLTIVSVQPDTFPIEVDHWIVENVDIVLKRLALAYDVEPQLSRTSTNVRMRESRKNAMPAGNPLQLDISTEVERQLKEQPTGQSVTITISVTPDGRTFGPDAEASPSTVDVTATLKSQRRTAQIPTVPILFAVSFANLEKPYRPVARDGTPLTLVTQTIMVTGPTDSVTRLLNGATRAYGIVQLKEEDLEQIGVLEVRTPEFHLPRGVELVEQPPPLEFKLIEASYTEFDR